MKLRKAAITFFACVRPSGAHGTRLPLDGLTRDLIFDDFSKNVSIKFRLHYNLKRKRVLYMKTDMLF